MNTRAGGRTPVTLLLLALAAFMSGCTAGSTVSAAGQEGVPLATSGSTLVQGIPVTGFGLSVADCDPGGTFLNFRLSRVPSGVDALPLQVEFDGRAAACQHPLGDPSILSCTIPPLTFYPVLVVVRTDEVELTEFTYDPAQCSVVMKAPEVQIEIPSAMPKTTATAVGLPATVSAEREMGATPTPSPTPTPTSGPVWPWQNTATQPPSPTQPSSTEPSSTEPPPTQPQSTEPPATQPPPPTQPPPTQPQSTEPPPPPPTEGSGSTSTPKPPPTQKPTPTHKPTNTPKPPQPTEPPQTEPPPTPSGLDINAPGPRLAWTPRQAPVAA